MALPEPLIQPTSAVGVANSVAARSLRGRWVPRLSFDEFLNALLDQRWRRLEPGRQVTRYLRRDGKGAPGMPMLRGMDLDWLISWLICWLISYLIS